MRILIKYVVFSFLTVIFFTDFNESLLLAFNSNNSASQSSKDFSLNKSGSTNPVLSIAPNGRYFIFPDGSTYTMNGINLFFLGYRFPVNLEPSGAEWVDYYFPKLQDHGMNYLRLFFSADSQYNNEGNSQHLDFVLDKAEENNLKIMLTIFNENWDFIEGGQNFTDEECIAIIDYVVDRWGNHPALLIWDICNDVGMLRDPLVTEKWADKMEDHLRIKDNYRHPVVFQIASYLNYHNQEFSHLIDNMDAVSVRAFQFGIEELVDSIDVKIERELSWGKPVYVSEFRKRTNPDSLMAVADEKISTATLHSLWTSYASGATGSHLMIVEPRENNESHYPMPSEEELDYYLAASKVLPKLRLGEFNYQSADNTLIVSDSNIKNYAINAGVRFFSYLYNPDNSQVSPQVTIANLEPGSYNIEWYNPKTGNLIFADNSQDQNISITAPSFQESIVLFVYDPSVNNPPQQDRLIVTSPDGGEFWEQGSEQTIRWNSFGNISDVKLEYSLDNGGGWNTIIQSTENDGSFLWSLPTATSNNCLIKISDSVDGNPSDLSDNTFSIGETSGFMEILINCDDAYELWINGNYVGSNNQWDLAQSYQVPLADEKNDLAVYGDNPGGPGGLIAEVKVGGKIIVETDGSWTFQDTSETGWTEVNFDDSNWEIAKEYGEYGSFPWYKNINNFPENSDVHWIWGENRFSKKTYFRKSFYVGVIENLPPPVINSFFPKSGSFGSEITIVGDGFLGVKKVKFGSIEAKKYVVDSLTQIRALVPHEALNGLIKVVTSIDSISSTSEFTLKDISDLNLVINEFLVLNDSINVDDDGDFESWIEIFNYDSSAIDLSGFTLTNEENNPTKWGFPFKIIPSNDYFLAWASGKDRNQDEGVHTNFKLDSLNGYIGLYNPHGEFVDSVTYNVQQKNSTEARIPNGLGDFIQSYFPSPKDSNTTTFVPVELISFKAKKMGKNQIELVWKTETEKNNLGFEIHRKNLKTEFKQIGFVTGEGTSFNPKEYSFSDELIENGLYSYRLKQIDLNGAFSFSPEVSIDFHLPEKFTILQNYPNPFNNETSISYFVSKQKQCKVVVYSVNGKFIKTILNEELSTGEHNIIWDATDFQKTPVASGIYLIHFNIGSESRILKTLYIR